MTTTHTDITRLTCHVQHKDRQTEEKTCRKERKKEWTEKETNDHNPYGHCPSDLSCPTQRQTDRRKDM